MMTPIFVIPILLFALTYPGHALVDRPDYIQCQSNSECDPGHCCTIGPIRYSIPQCRPMQTEGDICRPASVSAVNMTVGYPDGTVLTLKDVHYILCPCGDGLSCDDQKGVCKETSEKQDINRLFGEKSDQGD